MLALLTVVGCRRVSTQGILVHYVLNITYDRAATFDSDLLHSLHVVFDSTTHKQVCNYAVSNYVYSIEPHINHHPFHFQDGTRDTGVGYRT